MSIRRSKDLEKHLTIKNCHKTFRKKHYKKVKKHDVSMYITSLSSEIKNARLRL